MKKSNDENASVIEIETNATDRKNESNKKRRNRQPRPPKVDERIEKFDVDREWRETKVLQLRFAEVISLPSPTGQRNLQLSEEMYQGFRNTLIAQESLATITLAQTPDGVRHLIDGRHRQGGIQRFYLEMPENIRRYLELSFRQPAEILQVQSVEEAMKMFLVRNKNRRPLTQAEFNLVEFYPQIEGYMEFLESMRTTSFWTLLKKTMSEKEVLQLEPERVLEHVFAIVVKGRKSDSEAFRKILIKGKYGESIYSRIRESAVDIAGLVGDVGVPEGTDRYAREYQIAAQKILLNATAMLVPRHIDVKSNNGC